MQTKEFSNEQTMLTLAMASYAGFFDTGTNRMVEATLTHQVEALLQTLPPLQKDWELAFGPVTYRLPWTPVDQDMMFAVRSRSEPHRYVIAIRGTNPLSVFDWAVEDAWVGTLVPWQGPKALSRASAGAEPRVSMATALGLGVLLKMHGHSGVGAALHNSVSHLSTALTHLTQNAPRPLRKLGTGPLARRFETAGERVSSLFGLSEPASQTGGRVTDFLREAVLKADAPLEVNVVGHSLAGSLAPTLALWLAETQGSFDVGSEKPWDPNHTATVMSYSYGGPTQGDAHFAHWAEEFMGERVFRFANSLDIVPHGWNKEDLIQTPSLYGESVSPLPGFKAVVKLFHALTRNKGYTHIHADQPALKGTVNPRKTRFMEQMVYQHVDAYFELMGLSDCLNLESFFGPLARAVE